MRMHNVILCTYVRPACGPISRAGIAVQDSEVARNDLQREYLQRLTTVQRCGAASDRPANRPGVPPS